MRFTSPIEGLVTGIKILTAILLIVAVALNFANIIGRYVLNAPIASAEEIMLFLLVAVVFLGNSVVSWEGKQIRMDVFLHVLPSALRRWLEFIADLAVIAVSLVLIGLAWPVIHMLAEYDQRSQAADVPLYIPQALIPIGLGLTAILTLARLIKKSVRKRGVPDEHGPIEAA
jgi:TRAP-type C4-dicarboxylate transport system permease small subunit